MRWIAEKIKGEQGHDIDCVMIDNAAKYYIEQDERNIKTLIGLVQDNVEESDCKIPQYG